MSVRRIRLVKFCLKSNRSTKLLILTDSKLYRLISILGPEFLFIIFFVKINAINIPFNLQVSASFLDMCNIRL